MGIYSPDGFKKSVLSKNLIGYVPNSNNAFIFYYEED